jgi:cytidylate kinase
MEKLKISISGKPGSGKGTITKILQEKYDLPVFSAGNFRRDDAKSFVREDGSKGISIHDLNKISEENPVWDTRADDYQIEWSKNKDGFILESRLGYFFRPDTIKIYLTGNPLVLAKRIRNDSTRETEGNYQTLMESVRAESQRCASDNRRYLKERGIINCYDPDNFDIVIDTTHKSPERVAEVIDKKIIDYLQKAVHPKFYLAHATKSKDRVRELELQLEKATGIELLNPFFEGSALSPEEEEKGERKYLAMGRRVTEIYDKNMRQLVRKDVLGTIVIVDENWTWGAPSEETTTWDMSKLVYTLVLHNQEHYLGHPIVVKQSNKIFKTKRGLEDYLNSNKNKFFRELEKTRKRHLKDPVYIDFLNEINKNVELLG